MTYSDAYIEHWGDVYRSAPVVRHYCTFEQFLARPLYYIEEIGRAPLLVQLEVQRRLDAAGRQA